MENPYNQPYTAETAQWHGREKRIKIWRKFAFPPTSEGPILVCGYSQAVEGQIVGNWQSLVQTIGDYNFNWIPHHSQTGVRFHTVYMFEVIEHLQNPLYFLTRASFMLKEGGSIYLSTPDGTRPRFLWAKEHFNEYRQRDLEAMFDMAKLEVVRHERTPILWMKWYRYLRGFRPLLRLFFPLRCRLYQLKVKEQSDD